MANRVCLMRFFWCLFDKFWHSDDSKFIENPDPEAYPFFNLGALKYGLENNEKFVDVSVSIKIFDEDDIYTFKREMSANNVDGKWAYDNKSTFYTKKTTGTDGSTRTFDGNEAIKIRKEYFHENISNYFLFRGENREELAKLSGRGTFF